METTMARFASTKVMPRGFRLFVVGQRVSGELDFFVLSQRRIAAGDSAGVKCLALRIKS